MQADYRPRGQGGRRQSAEGLASVSSTDSYILAPLVTQQQRGSFSATVSVSPPILDLLDDLREQQALQNRSLLSSAWTFVPKIIKEAIIDNKIQEDTPIVCRCEGAVVFSDASGFTALTERLAQRSNGAELLSQSLNKFFTPLIDMLTAYKGDVIKFSGDALTVLFAAAPEDEQYTGACGSPNCSHTPLELACLRAAACCLEIHKRLHMFDTGVGGVRLTLHIGVGAGEVTILQVGGLKERFEYVISGEPLAQIAIAEPLAGSGETVLSPQCWVHVEDTVIEGEPIEENPSFHRLVGLDTWRHSYPTVKQAAQQTAVSMDAALDEYPPEELERWLGSCIRYIPRSVLKQFWTGSLRGINEMRAVSIIFVQIGGIDVSTDDGAMKAKLLMHGMQTVVYAEEGNLNKFLVDDKGLLFLFVFGLPPLVHIDDPSRACRASLEMTELLVRMKLTGRIGITTGRVYCGLVGSDTRREYTAMGDTVNLSARLMANSQPNTVLTDEATFLRARHDCNWMKLEPIKVKGKEQKINIFRPMKSTDDFIVPAGADLLEGAEREKHGVEVSSQSAGRFLVSVPWTPQGTALGGKSPLPLVESWPPLRAITEAMNDVRKGRGSLMFISGESGCGKEELAEVVIKECVQGCGMVPLFGTMMTRPNESLSAHRHLLARILMLLHRNRLDRLAHDELLSDAELELLLHAEGISQQELRAVRFMNEALAAPSSRIGSSSPEETGDLGTMSMQSFMMDDSSKAANYVRNMSLSKRLSSSFFGHGDGVSEEQHRNSMLITLISRLLKKLMRTEKVVVVLRRWRSTTVTNVPSDELHFWELVRNLGRLCSADNHGQLVLVVLSRVFPFARPRTGSNGSPRASNADATFFSFSGHHHRHGSHRASFSSAPSPRGSSVAEEKEAEAFRLISCGLLSNSSDMIDVHCDDLTEQEVLVYIALLLGVGSAAQQAEEVVPHDLLKWLCGITLKNPRNIQEALAELQKEGKVEVKDGRVLLKAGLDTVDIAGWVHTAMVGTIISRLEAMEAEAQRVIKMAAALDGPFSALDVAAANKVHRPTSDILAFYDAVQLLMSCKFLVADHFLESYVSIEEDPQDGQTRRLPRWVIPNLLIRKVVSSTLLQSQRIQVKQAVLMQRALNIALPERMKRKAERQLALFGPRRKRPMTSTNVAHARESLLHENAVTSALPSSCIVQMKEKSNSRTKKFTRLTQIASKGSELPDGDAAKNGDQPDVRQEALAELLLLMCSAGNESRVRAMLEQGAPVSICDDAGLSPLHFACARGELELVKTLLDADADPSYKSTSYGTPLEIAVMHGHLHVAQYLVEECGILPPTGPMSTSTYWEERLGPSAPNLSSPHPLPVLTRGAGPVDVQQENRRRSEVLNTLHDALGDDEKILVRSKSDIGKLSRRCSFRIPLGIVYTCILLAIFGPDLWVLFKFDQLVLDVLLTMVMMLFLVEIATLVWQDPGYWKTFFFTLDVTGTIALVFEISFLAGPSYEDEMKVSSMLDGQTGSFNANVARAAKMARIGTWLGRKLLVVRFLFLANPRNWGQDLPSTEAQAMGGVERFRGVLEHTIARYVANLAVMIIVFLPLLNYMLYPKEDMSMAAWADILAMIRPDTQGSPWTSSDLQTELTEFQDFYEDLAYGPFRICSASGLLDGCGAGASWMLENGTNCCITQSERFEDQEWAMNVLDVDDSGRELALSFDFSRARQSGALINIALILFVLTVMVFTTLFISRIISIMVLAPLHRMLESVKRIARPLFEQFGDETDSQNSEDDEIFILEKVVQKLGKIAGLASEQAATEYKDMAGMGNEQQGVVQMVAAVVQPQKAEASADQKNILQIARSANIPALEEMKTRLEKLLITYDDLTTWDVSLLSLDRTKQTGLSGWMLTFNSIQCGEVTVKPEALAKFLQGVNTGYWMDCPYHNWSHACDVMHTAWQYLRLTRAEAFFSGLEQFALLVSAISHDVGHLGVNNQYLIEVGHELAVRYNDKSILENMHCAKLFEIVADKQANVFDTLSRADFFQARRICIAAILHTDMSFHFEMVKECQLLYSLNSDSLDPCQTLDERDEVMSQALSERDAKQKVLNLFLHSSDISNPCKPWALCQAWALRCLDEFFAQGDQEKQLGIPVQMLNDRDKVNKPLSQIGFIEFMIVPLNAAQTKLFPGLHELSENLASNMWEWHRIWVDEQHPAEDEERKVHGRVQRATDTLAESRPARPLGSHLPQGSSQMLPGASSWTTSSFSNRN